MKTWIWSLVLVAGSMLPQEALSRRLVMAGVDTGDVAACSARASLVHKLQDKHDNLHQLLVNCTKPTLYLSYKFTTPAQAVAYCNSETCHEFVAQLRAYPACTWKDIPRTSPGVLLTAERVLHDCDDQEDEGSASQ